MAKTMISIDDNTLKKLDKYVAENSTTRSGAITQAVKNLLLQDEIAHSISVLAYAAQKIAMDKEITEETKKKLDEITTLYEIMTSKS